MESSTIMMRYFSIILLILVFGGTVAMAAADQGTTITLHFPERSVGYLHLISPGMERGGPLESRWRTGYLAIDTGIGMAAKGDVTLPAGWHYSLRLTRSALLESDAPGSPTLAQLAPERLEALQVDGGEMTARGVARLRAATRLERLRLTPRDWAAKQAAGAVFAALGQLTSLRELMIRKGDALSSASLGQLAKLPKLEYLILNGSEASAQDFAELAKLPALRMLSIKAGGRVRGIGALGRSASLRYLRVEGLDVEALRELGKLGSLKGLMITEPARGELKDEDCQAIAKLAQLEGLTLGLNARGPAAGLARIAGMRSLKRLALPFETTAEELEIVAKMDGLEELSVGSRVTGRGVAAVARLTGLKSLSVRELDCAPEELAPLAGLKRLEKISIGDGMGEQAIERILALKSLRTIGLWTGLQQNTRMSTATLARLGEMPNLERFGTSYILGDREVLSIPELAHLKALTLSSSFRMSDAGLAHLARFKGLEELDLHGSGLTYEGLMRLAALPRLKKLNLLAGRKLSQEEIQRIAQAIPGFEVQYLMER